MAVVEEQRKLPQLQGIEVIVLQNQAENIRSSLTELRNAGLLGAGLALVVLFLFMRDWPTTLIVGLAVPFSLLITVAAMYFLGFSLNILTMMGMLLAIGLLVDNAVVVTESIFRHRQVAGADPIASTLTGVTEVGLAVLAGTLSTVIVFLPIIFGEESEIAIFMVHVAVPIVVAMLASLLVAQTLIPTLTARFPPPPAIRAGSFFARIQDWYLRRLDWLFAHKWWAALFVVLTVAVPGAAVRDRAREDGHVPAGRVGPAVPARITSRAPTRSRAPRRPSRASSSTSRPTRSGSASTSSTATTCRTMRRASSG